MADFLTVVKTTKKVQNNIQIFESLSLLEPSNTSNSNIKQPPVIEVHNEIESEPLLTAIGSKLVTADDGDEELRPAQKSLINPLHKRQNSTAFVQKSYLKEKGGTLVDDAREILKSQPSLEDVEAVLSYIQYGIEGQHDFNIKVTSPKAGLLVHTLVSTTLPDLWPNLNLTKISKTDLRMKDTLSAALFSVTGIDVILEHIRRLSGLPSPNTIVAKVYSDFLADMLESSDTVVRLLQDMKLLYAKEVQRKLFWQSIIGLLAGGKLLSTTASVPVDENNPTSWLSDGNWYSRWLARNIVRASTRITALDTVAWSNLGQLLRRGLSLGYKDTLVAEIYTSLLLGQHALWSPLHSLLKSVPARDQKTFFDSVLNDLSHTYFSALQNALVPSTDMTTAKAISGAAALINGLITHNEYLLECAVEWVTSSNGVTRGSGLRRALIAVLAQSQGNLQRILERSLTMFSENTQIQNSSTAQQEHLAQIILLVIGQLHRLHPQSLKQDPIPTLMMRSVSNRLSSSVPRTRLLGMIVGVGMSRCVDEPGKTMNFHVEEMETPEVKEMLALIDLNDTIGVPDDLGILQKPQETGDSSKKREMTPSKSPKLSKPTTKILAIEEASSSSEDEDDLVPYRKPVEDPEDSDEDPTLINRNKPKAPIYIVDLIKQLQLPNDKLDTISLALKTAASLIRRKADFGTELADNIHSLAAALINLQEGMSKPEHQQQRLDALVACLIARPAVMGKYLASTYFDGDFSLSQRSTLLIAIGLGARELAGFTDATKQLSPGDLDLFPSERLPRQIQPKPLTSPTGPRSPARPHHNPIAALSNAATHDMIRPLALAAAEFQAGPRILQINRTSSFLTTKSKKQQQQSTTRKIPKQLNALLSNNIYLPLASPLTTTLTYTALHSSSSNHATLLLHPSILTLHLQTLTLLLHTLGPIGLSPPTTFNAISHETLVLLSALTRSRLSLDGIVLPALLGLLLALIDITVAIGVMAQERLLGDEFGGVVSELVRWVGGLEGIGAPPPMEGAEGNGMAWTVLAAGVQVRWMEIGRRFQGRMLGLADDGF